MPKAPSVSLTKIIEAAKLNPRNGLPMGGPPVTVPYGALVEPVASERDEARFLYLNELYGCKYELFVSATGGAKTVPAAEPVVEQTPVPAALPHLMEEVEPAAPSGPRLEWQKLNSGGYPAARTAIPGGWLVMVGGSGVTFVPDAKHRWDGGSAK